MSAENTESPTTVTEQALNDSYYNEAPLIALLEDHPPLEEMSELEKQTFVRRLREFRTSVQTMRAEVTREATDEPKARKPKKPTQPKVDLSAYD